MSNDPRSQYDCICRICNKDYRGGAKSNVCQPCKKVKYPPKAGSHKKKRVDNTVFSR